MFEWIDVELISCFEYENSHFVFLIIIKGSLEIFVAQPVKNHLFSLFLDYELTVTIKREIFSAHRNSLAIVEVEKLQLQVGRCVLCIIFDCEVVKSVRPNYLDRVLLFTRLYLIMLLLKSFFLGIFSRNEDKTARFIFVIILYLDHRPWTAQKRALRLFEVS